MQESHGKIKLNFSYYMGLKCCLNNFELAINKIVYEVYENLFGLVLQSISINQFILNLR